MVVGLLVRYFKPAKRGLKSEETDEFGSPQIRASHAVHSMAADIDIICDYVFLAEVEGRYPRVPHFLWTMQLITTLLGTLVYVFIASDGHLLNPILKELGVRKFSTGDMLVLGILVEDLPQIILTAIIVSFYADDVSYGALMNFTTAFYDIAIKTAEAFDERKDMRHTGASMKIYRMHYGPVTALTKCNDFVFLSASLDETIKLVSIEGGHRIKCFFGHKNGVACLAKVDENKFLSGSADYTIRLWDMSAPKSLKTYFGHVDCVNSITMLDDYRFISVSHDHTARIWSIHSTRCLKILEGHINFVMSVAAIDHKTVLTASADGNIKLWDVFDGVCLRTFSGHLSQVRTVILLNKEKYLFLSGSYDFTVKLWNWVTGECVRTFCLNLMEDERVTCLSKIDKETFLCGYSNGTLVMWNINLDESVQQFSGHTDSINSILLSEKGKSFVTGSDDNTSRLWALEGSEADSKSTCHFVEFVECLHGSESDMTFDQKDKMDGKIKPEKKTSPELEQSLSNYRLMSSYQTNDSFVMEKRRDSTQLQVEYPEPLMDSNLELICTRSLLTKSMRDTR